MFLAADEPHAYISGDCVEVMANSDNVIRAGLTPKFRDVGELVRMLTYSEPAAAAGAAGAEQKGWHPATTLAGTPRDDFTVVYAPPDDAVTEFQLERTTYNNEQDQYKLAVSSFASVLIVIEGRGEAKWDHGIGRTALARGAVFFQPAGTRLAVTGSNLTLYRVTRRGAVAAAS